MGKESFSDTVVISGLKENNSPVIQYLYRELYPGVKSFVLNNTGSESDAEDVFQDTMVILYRKIKGEELTLSCSLKTYFFAVARNLWLQRLELRKRSGICLPVAESAYTENEDFDRELMHMERLNMLQKYLMAMDKECQRLLRLFLQKMSLKEITVALGFSSTDYTKFRKYQCKNRLKKQMMEDPYCKWLCTYE